MATSGLEEATVGSAALMVARKKVRAVAQSKGDVVMTPAGQDRISESILASSSAVRGHAGLL